LLALRPDAFTMAAHKHLYQIIHAKPDLRSNSDHASVRNSSESNTRIAPGTPERPEAVREWRSERNPIETKGITKEFLWASDRLCQKFLDSLKDIPNVVEIYKKGFTTNIISILDFELKSLDKDKKEKDTLSARSKSNTAQEQKYLATKFQDTLYQVFFEKTQRIYCFQNAHDLIDYHYCFFCHYIFLLLYYYSFYFFYQLWKVATNLHKKAKVQCLLKDLEAIVKNLSKESLLTNSQSTRFTTRAQVEKLFEVLLLSAYSTIFVSASWPLLKVEAWRRFLQPLVVIAPKFIEEPTERH
jgi:hypothetical protein